MEVNGKKYEVLEIHKKSRFPSQDVYVCLSEYGYKECFLGFDIEHPTVDKIHEYSRAWTIEEKEYIRKKLLEGSTINEIKKGYINPRRTEGAIENTAYQIKGEIINKWEVGKM